jgi:hypothetical protein
MAWSCPFVAGTDVRLPCARHDAEHEGPVDVLAPRDRHEVLREAAFRTPGRRSRVGKGAMQPEGPEGARVLGVDSSIVRRVDVDRRVGDLMALRLVVSGVARGSRARGRAIGLVRRTVAVCRSRSSSSRSRSATGEEPSSSPDAGAAPSSEGWPAMPPGRRAGRPAGRPRATGCAVVGRSRIGREDPRRRSLRQRDPRGRVFGAGGSRQPPTLPWTWCPDSAAGLQSSTRHAA